MEKVKRLQYGRQAYLTWRSSEITVLNIDYNLDLGSVSLTLLGFWISYWWGSLKDGD